MKFYTVTLFSFMVVVVVINDWQFCFHCDWMILFFARLYIQSTQNTDKMPRFMIAFVFFLNPGTRKNFYDNHMQQIESSGQFVWIKCLILLLVVVHIIVLHEFSISSSLNSKHVLWNLSNVVCKRYFICIDCSHTRISNLFEWVLKVQLRLFSPQKIPR